MWNKPQLMTAVSDLLFVAAAAALLVAAVLWIVRLPWFPLREVVVTHELREVRRSEVERSLTGHLAGNFFSTNLDIVRQSLEQLPWVRHAEVRRQWPSRIEVTIEEHVPVAFWGTATGQLVNSRGEIFAAAMTVPPPESMPVLLGPTGMVPEMLAYYQQAEELLYADLLDAARDVAALVKVPVTDNQFAALTSFEFNLGSLRTSTLLRKLNTGDYEGAAREFSRWVKGRVNDQLVTLPGLVSRRRAEQELFQS